MPKAEEESDAESQKRRKRQIKDQSNHIRQKRRMLSIEDVTDAISGVDGRTLNELPGWLRNTILSVIQQLKEAIRAKGTS